MPLGANMAARRNLFQQIGGFRADLGRTGGRLVLGQEVPELLLRARSAGLRGIYVPAMEVRHHIPAKRLTPAYFRTWWFGKGVSRAALERMQPVTELGIDLRHTPHVLGVPRYMYGSGDAGRHRDGARAPVRAEGSVVSSPDDGSPTSRGTSGRGGARGARARRPRITRSNLQNRLSGRRRSSPPAGDRTPSHPMNSSCRKPGS